jgi:hypothetical protein
LQAPGQPCFIYIYSSSSYYYFLKTSFLLLSPSRDFPAANQVLHGFPELRPYVLLMGWDILGEDADARGELLAIHGPGAFSSPRVEPRVAAACQRLAGDLGVARRIAGMSRGTLKVNAVLQALRSHSVTFVARGLFGSAEAETVMAIASERGGTGRARSAATLGGELLVLGTFRALGRILRLVSAVLAEGCGGCASRGAVAEAVASLLAPATADTLAAGAVPGATLGTHLTLLEDAFSIALLPRTAWTEHPHQKPPQQLQPSQLASAKSEGNPKHTCGRRCVPAAAAAAIVRAVWAAALALDVGARRDALCAACAEFAFRIASVIDVPLADRDSRAGPEALDVLIPRLETADAARGDVLDRALNAPRGLLEDLLVRGRLAACDRVAARFASAVGGGMADVEATRGLQLLLAPTAAGNTDERWRVQLVQFFFHSFIFFFHSFFFF